MAVEPGRTSGPFAIKDHRRLVADTRAGAEGSLKRAVGARDLTALGVGAVIGTGIFVLTGVAAHDKTGPALMLSFVVAGLACIKENPDLCNGQRLPAAAEARLAELTAPPPAPPPKAHPRRQQPAHQSPTPPYRKPKPVSVAPAPTTAPAPTGTAVEPDASGKAPEPNFAAPPPVRR